MRLSKLYSTKAELFGPIEFRNGLNFVVAEIHDPTNLRRDTHNLGKTTLGRVIDFCLLREKHPEFFLHKNPVFEQFTFLIELRLSDDSYLTVCRSVKESSRVALRVDQQSQFVAEDADWTHPDLSFDRAKELLEGLLGLSAIKPFGFRKALGYALRSQEDYRDVFQLDRFKGVHADWKPFLAGLIGLDWHTASAHYEIQERLEERASHEVSLRGELLGAKISEDQLRGMVQLKRADVDQLQEEIEAFDLTAIEKKVAAELTDDVEFQLARLTNRRYEIGRSLRRIEIALREDSPSFDPQTARQVFADVGVFFPESLKKSFEQLLEFKRQVTAERRTYLRRERKALERELSAVALEIDRLEGRRRSALQFLRQEQLVGKYRDAMSRMTVLRTDVAVFERQLEAFSRLTEVQAEIREMRNARVALINALEENLRKSAEEGTRYASIRAYFSQIIDEVIGRKALLSTNLNKEGNLEFRAELLDTDGRLTSQDEGHSYRKLLCIAFDLAVARAYVDEHFIHFVFHDGAFETLDPRKKSNLLTVMRRYADFGVQQVITSLDSDLPEEMRAAPIAESPEVILHLHDQGPDGRLFRMAEW